MTLGGETPTRYLVAISIGPVQDFINTARRSRDLWFGSWLLSELAKAAVHYLVSQYKRESLIFPAIDDPNDIDPQNTKSDFTVVNKILAIVDTADTSSLMEAVKQSVQERLNDLRRQAFPSKEGSFKEKSAIAQVNDLLEFFWAAVPLGNDYPQSREQVDALLIARKNTREFNSTRDWSGHSPKSSLDGQRESVIDESTYPTRTDNSLERAAKVRYLFKRYHARGGERLCGVGLLKRLGNRRGDDSFFSTSHVAALPLMTAVKDHRKVQAYVQALIDAGVKLEELHGVPLPRGGPLAVPIKAHPPAFEIPGQMPHKGRAWDGHILFEERLRDYFDANSPAAKDGYKLAKQALRRFLDEALTGTASEPLPYYTLLHADGDGMGRAIESLTKPQDHRRLSERLTKFAKGVAKIVEHTHHGSLVYSGGDDVLAFVPLHTTLNCARALADDFGEKLQEFKDKDGSSPTLSVGLAITHHLEPLSDALELARDAEREAKRLPGKNALCITMSKRSGETTAIADHWGRIDTRLRFFTLLHVADKLPDGVAYELRCLAEQLKEVPRAGVAAEVARILTRKRAERGQEELDRKVIVRIQRALEELSETTNSKSPLLRLAEELIVSRMLAAGYEQAFQNQEQAKDEARKKLDQVLQSVNLESEG